MTTSSATVLFALSIVAASFSACGSSTEDPAADVDEIAIARHHRRPPGTTTGGSTSSTTTGGAGGSRAVACYSQGAPNTICTGSDYCCYHNYSATHDGYCTTDTDCGFGRIWCDGPEDCGAGNVCCAQRFTDESTGIALSYMVACHAGSACPKGTWQLCHSGGCPSGQTCQSNSVGINAELPKIESICAP